MDMIQLVGVTKRYGHYEALRNLTLNIAQGEMAFITGHSGAGKTTLLKLIGFLEPCSYGQVVVNGLNLTRIKKKIIPHFRRNIGMVFQDCRLLNDRSVFDNVALPLVIAGYRPTEIASRVRAALNRVALLKKANAMPQTLSGGEQQRVGIARAVINKPAILLADEPTGNLDPELSWEIMRLFEEFHKMGTTVLIASHDRALIDRLAHSVYCLKNGTLQS